VPAPVAPVPLVIIADPEQRPGDTLAGDASTVCANRDDVETRRRAVAQSGKILLDANQAALRQDRQDQGAFDRAPAWLAGSQYDLRLKGACRSDLGNRRENLRRALGISRRYIFDLIADRLERLVLQPGGEAREGGQLRLARGIDLDVTGDFEICAGCAIEVAGHRGYFDRIASPRRRRGRGQRKFETLRDIIFDQEARSPDRSGFRIGKSLDAPGPRRNARQQQERKTAAAIALIFDLDPLIFDAIGAFDDEGERQGRYAGAKAIAQQRG